MFCDLPPGFHIKRFPIGTKELDLCLNLQTPLLVYDKDFYVTSQPVAE